MASSQNGNIGIYSGYSDHDNGWTSQHNQNWDSLDALTQLNVLNTTTTTPPSSPSSGDAYIVGLSATGAWSGKDKQIAVWVARSSSWLFIQPKSGWFAVNKGDGNKIYSFDGSSWSITGAAATVSVGTVTTGAAGTSASVVNSGTATNAVLDFTIPRGADGSGGGGAIISTDTTLNVPADYSTINAAMSYLRNYMIGDGVLVTVKVADGSYSISSPFELHHRDGKQINIIGNTTTPSSVLITFSGDGAFVLSGAYEIGLIDGFKVSSTLWTSHGNWSARGGSAVAATFGAIINLGSKMQIEKSYYGVRAAEGGVIRCDAGVAVDEAGDGGFFAFSTGFIECMGCTSTNAADSSNGLGFGFIAENNGAIRADGSTSSGNLISGFFSNTNGAMWAKNTTSNNNARHGYEIERLSTAEVNGSSANNNSFHGLYVAHNSYALATGLSGSGNPSGITGTGSGGIIE